MDCKTANSYMIRFLDEGLPLEETEGLLKHIRECRDCREDMEIYYTVKCGIEGLNKDKFETYDLKQKFETEMKKAYAYAKRCRFILWLRNLTVIAACASAAAAVFIQLTRWF